MKRTACFVAAFALALTMVASAQTSNGPAYGINAPGLTGGNYETAFSGVPAVTQDLPDTFTEAALIEYVVEKSGRVRMCVYDADGNLVDILVDAYRDAGSYTVVWAAPETASGTYTCILSYGNTSKSRKITVLK